MISIVFIGKRRVKCNFMIEEEGGGGGRRGKKKEDEERAEEERFSSRRLLYKDENYGLGSRSHTHLRLGTKQQQNNA